MFARAPHFVVPCGPVATEPKQLSEFGTIDSVADFGPLPSLLGRAPDSALEPAPEQASSFPPPPLRSGGGNACMVRWDGLVRNHRFHRASSAGSLEHRKLDSATVLASESAALPTILLAQRPTRRPDASRWSGVRSHPSSADRLEADGQMRRFAEADQAGHYRWTAGNVRTKCLVPGEGGIGAEIPRVRNQTSLPPPSCTS